MSTTRIPKQASIWDERRNSSQVLQPLPNAVPDALQALATFRRNFPREARWIEEGAPPLTEAEHLQRFGHAYDRPKRRARSV